MQRCGAKIVVMGHFRTLAAQQSQARCWSREAEGKVGHPPGQQKPAKRDSFFPCWGTILLDGAFGAPEYGRKATVMGQGEGFRASAIECVEAAASSTDPEAAAALLLIAEKLLDLAQRCAEANALLAVVADEFNKKQMGGAT
jgi:hypothetical protein